MLALIILVFDCLQTRRPEQTRAEIKTVGKGRKVKEELNGGIFLNIIPGDLVSLGMMQRMK